MEGGVVEKKLVVLQVFRLFSLFLPSPLNRDDYFCFSSRALGNLQLTVLGYFCGSLILCPLETLVSISPIASFNIFLSS